MSPFQSSMRANYLHGVSVRSPTGPDAAWYTRGNRPDIAVTTSHVFVVRSRANSSTGIRSPSWAPSSVNSSSIDDRRSRDVGDVDHDRVHRDVADERDPPTADQRLRPIRQRARPAVAVAEGQRRDPTRTGRRERRAIAHAVAGGQVGDADRLGVRAT